MTTREIAAANAETVRRFQATMRDAAQFIRDRPEEAKAALANAYKDLDPAAIDVSFDQQWRNWTMPAFTEADMRQEVRLLNASRPLPGLLDIDPASLLLKQP
jgi:ABC-type nitrate/sulfonate/bicarbonate transport system substrate-binding protein